MKRTNWKCRVRDWTSISYKCRNFLCWRRTWILWWSFLQQNCVPYLQTKFVQVSNGEGILDLKSAISVWNDFTTSLWTWSHMTISENWQQCWSEKSRSFLHDSVFLAVFGYLWRKSGRQQRPSALFGILNYTHHIIHEEDGLWAPMKKWCTQVLFVGTAV